MLENTSKMVGVLHVPCGTEARRNGQNHWRWQKDLSLCQKYIFILIILNKYMSTKSTSCSKSTTPTCYFTIIQAIMEFIVSPSLIYYYTNIVSVFFLIYWSNLKVIQSDYFYIYRRANRMSSGGGSKCVH